MLNRYEEDNECNMEQGANMIPRSFQPQLRVESGGKDFETWLKEFENMTRTNYTVGTANDEFTLGIMLSGYTILFGLGALVLPDSITTYIDILQDAQVGFPILAAIKFILAFPLTYHFWNGIRHLMWDLGKYLTLKEVYATGYIMLAVAYASAAILSIM